LSFGDDDYERVATTYNNDGFELWLGEPDRWYTFYSAHEARQLAWFVLWDWWIVATWCGLKRAIWYWALHVIVHRETPSVEVRSYDAVKEAKTP
jgi:hypothetical protein